MSNNMNSLESLNAFQHLCHVSSSGPARIKNNGLNFEPQILQQRFQIWNEGIDEKKFGFLGHCSVLTSKNAVEPDARCARPAG
jgi:hypothetical protein